MKMAVVKIPVVQSLMQADDLMTVIISDASDERSRSAKLVLQGLSITIVCIKITTIIIVGLLPLGLLEIILGEVAIVVVVVVVVLSLIHI